MASLNGTTPAATYPALIKFDDNSAIGAAKRLISDGAGGATPLYLSSTQLNIGGTGLIDATLGIKGAGATTATSALKIENSSAGKSLTYNNGGELSINFGGATQKLDGFNFFAYGMTSANGASKVNIDGGAMTLIDSAGQNNIVAQNNQTYIFKPLKLQALGTGIVPNAAAILDMESTTKGFLPPRMTTVQKTAIAAVPAGLILYDTTTNKLQCYNGTIWNDLF